MTRRFDRYREDDVINPELQIGQIIGGNGHRSSPDGKGD